MKLYCVRHGEALPAEASPDRPLSEDGQIAVSKVATHMQRCNIDISHIMHSSLLRAAETAAIFADVLEIRDKHELAQELDESASIEPLCQMISTWTEDTMLVGHLPFMHELICHLVTPLGTAMPIVSFPPGSVACLEYYEAQRWVIKWHINPSIVLDA